MASNRKFLFVNSDNEFEAEQESVSSSSGAPDAGKLATLDAGGQWDPSFIDDGGIDHGGLAGLSDDDHILYIRVDGTRAFTGPQSMGNSKLTSLADGTISSDAINLGQLNSAINGFDWKDSVRVATTGNITLSGEQTLDGVTTSTDRILVKNQSLPEENGIYVSAAGAWSRSEDANTDAEVTSGLTVAVEEGATQADYTYQLTTNNPITLGTTGLVFTKISVNTLKGDDGIDITGDNISVDLAAVDPGLKFVSAKLAVDFADTSDSNDLDGTNDEKPIAAEDLALNGANQGANILGADPSSISQSVGTDIQQILEDLSAAIVASGGSVSYTVDTGGVTKGDLVYNSANDKVKPLPITGGAPASSYGIGVAASTESASATVEVLANDVILAGVLTSLSPTVGDKIFWDGSALTLAAPTGGGSRIWQVGIAKNADDLHVEIAFIQKNAA